MPAKKEKFSSAHILIFELEYIAAKIRRVEFEAVKKTVAPMGVDLTPAKFSRSGMSPLRRTVIASLLKQTKKKSAAIEKAEAKVNTAVADYCENEAVLDKGLAKLIKAAQKRGISIAALTTLPEDTAEKLMTRLELDSMGVELIVPETVKESFPRADDWLKILKQYKGKEQAFVAVISSHIACRGALTVGASCIAVPDEFTAFQSYSGAMLITDDLAKEQLEPLLDLSLRM